MQERIQDYLSVNLEYNSELKRRLEELERRIIQKEAEPDNLINQILNEQMKRVKAKSCSHRRPNYPQAETREVKRKIQSLKKQVRELKIPIFDHPRMKRESKNDLPLEFSVLKKQFEVRNKVYLEQKRRTEIQKRQILSIKNAIDGLNLKLRNRSQSPQSITNNSTKQIKILQKKKKNLLQIRKEAAESYEQQLKNKMNGVMNVDRSAFERQALERKIDRELSYQRQIINNMEKDAPNNRCSAEYTSDYESVRAFNNRNRRKDLQSQKWNSIDQISFSRQRDALRNEREFRTLTTDNNTPARIREPNPDIIIEKRRSFRTPVNLSPSKFQLGDLRNQRLLTASQNIQPQTIKSPIVRKDSMVNAPVCQLKINETRNLDVSITSSMYNKIKGIELLNESFVQLGAVKQKSKFFSKQDGSSQHKQTAKSRILNQSLNKSSFSKFQKSVLETTKQQINHAAKNNNFKGVPFECCDQPEQTEVNESMMRTKELHRQIPRRYRGTSLQVQDQF